MLSGILNVDKPAGLTSHDVVDVVRRLSGQRRVGHAGTLDPMATGVLLVCLGSGTRVAEYLVAGRKRYRAGIALGAATTTYDCEGQVTECGGRVDFRKDEIEAALARFTGQLEQIPPIYSAIKLDGEPLYRRARRGESVELKPRTVEIDELVVLDWSPAGSGGGVPLLTLEVTCSPGTYIRSLANDLGRALGSCAYLSSLVRLRSGRFGLEEAASLSLLEEAFREGAGKRYLLPVDEALLDWPAMVLTPDDARRCLQESGCDALRLGRGIVADPGLAIAIASGGGRQLDWPEVLELLADFWVLVGRHFEPGYRAGRLKQWLQFLRQRHPQAAEAYLRLRTVTDSRAIAVGLFGVEKAQALELALAESRVAA